MHSSKSYPRELMIPRIWNRVTVEYSLVTPPDSSNIFNRNFTRYPVGIKKVSPKLGDSRVGMIIAGIVGYDIRENKEVEAI